MISLLLLSTLIRFGFSPSTKATYDVSVAFEGYLPIIGGREGRVDLEMSVLVEGQPADADGAPQVASEIQTFKMSLNKALMPFTEKNVADFFPRTTISVSPFGTQLKTDAPDKVLPVRLPGLDVKRFPAITYLPIEFPAEGIEVGKPYHFKKAFGDADVDYEVTPTAISDDEVALKIHLSQSYVSFEDAVHNPVKEDKATIRISTDVVGDGTATFDRRAGLIRDTNLVADATGKAVDVKTNESTDRHLKTTLTIHLKSQLVIRFVLRRRRCEQSPGSSFGLRRLILTLLATGPESALP